MSVPAAAPETIKPTPSLCGEDKKTLNNGITPYWIDKLNAARFYIFPYEETYSLSIVGVCCLSRLRCHLFGAVPSCRRSGR